MHAITTATGKYLVTRNIFTSNALTNKAVKGLRHSERWH